MGRRELVLWHFQASHFCEKARWALDWKRVPHRREVLAASYLPRAWWRTGRGTLPVLLTGEGAIGDSARIVAWLEARFPDPPLYPADPRLRERALALEAWLGEELGHPLRAVLAHEPLATDPAWCARFATMGLGPGHERAFRAVAPLFSRYYRMRHGIHAATWEGARARAFAAMDRIAAEAGPSGYLAGDAFSVADLTAAALLGVAVQPPELEYPLPSPRPDSLAAWQERVARHPAGAWAREMYRRHRGAPAEPLG